MSWTGSSGEMTARRWFWITFTLFAASAATVLVGFPTCDTEAGTCAEWHTSMNLVAVIGTGIFLVIVLILALMTLVDVTTRRRETHTREWPTTLTCASVPECPR